MMLRDAKEWLLSKDSAVNLPHPKTGATPLHVASAKGYIEVVKYVRNSKIKTIISAVQSFFNITWKSNISALIKLFERIINYHFS